MVTSVNDDGPRYLKKKIPEKKVQKKAYEAKIRKLEEQPAQHFEQLWRVVISKREEKWEKKLKGHSNKKFEEV